MIGYWVAMALLFCAIAAVLAAVAEEGASGAPTNRTEQWPPMRGRVRSDAIGDASPNLGKPNAAAHPAVTPPPDVDAGNRDAAGSTVATP